MLSGRLRKFGFDQLSEKDMKEILEALEVREGIETLINASGPQHAVCVTANSVKYGLIHKEGFSEGQTLHAAIRAAVEAQQKGTG